MKKIQLGIPEPCHENWNNMKPEEKGRFCNSCQKTVMDFRDMSDRQLAEFFKKPAGSVCGRFNADQLNREIQIPRKHIPWVKYFFQFSLPAFLFSMKAAAQGRVVVQEKTSIQEKTGFSSAGNKIQLIENSSDSIPKNNRIVLKGFITDETGRAVEKASITIKGTNIGTLTDENGKFSLACSSGQVAFVSCVGFVTQEFIVKDSEVKISLMQHEMTLGELVVVKIECKRGPKPEPKIADSITRILKIFPNPVIKGNLIKIDISQLKEGKYQVNILNSDGLMIRSRTYDHYKHNNWIEERTSGLMAGSYFINFTEKKTGKVFTEKFIVQ